MKFLSVITIVYNGQDVLDVTIQSVMAQNRDLIEYIIIDGNSTDDTQKIIDRYRDDIDILISEPDKGIYDAMNKGLRSATGEYVIFMNAGDCFANEHVVEKLSQFRPDADIIYGETILVNDAREHQGLRSEITTRKLPKNLKWQDLKNGLVVCHQSFLPKRNIAPEYILGNLSADIDWVIRCLKKSQSAVFYDGVISEFLMGGVSKQRHWTSLKDRARVLVNHFGIFSTIVQHMYFIIRALTFKLPNK